MKRTIILVVVATVAAACTGTTPAPTSTVPATTSTPSTVTVPPSTRPSTTSTTGPAAGIGDVLPARVGTIALATPDTYELLGWADGWAGRFAHADRLAGAAFPVGGAVVYQRADGEVRLGPAGPGGIDETLMETDAVLQDVATSQGGPVLVLLGDREVLIRAPDGTTARLPIDIDQDITEVAYGGGRYVMVVAPEGADASIELRDAGGDPLPSPSFALPVAAAAMAPDGASVAVVLAGKDASALVVHDLVEGLVLRWNDLPALDDVDFDGRTVLASGPDGRVVVGDLDTGTVETAISTPGVRLRWDRIDRPFLAAVADTALDDGRVFARILTVRPTAEGWDAVIDPAEWLTGEAPAEAAGEDGTDAPDDFSIRNRDTDLFTVPIAPAATLTLIGLVDGDPEPVTSDIEDLAEELSGTAPNRWYATGFYWLDIVDGEVVAIEQQYVP